MRTSPTPRTSAAAMPALAFVTNGACDSFTTVDGKVQATIDGSPLYYFAADAAAGDTKGQNVGGVWFVVDATGAMKK
ncbi:MAG: hypothetical protein F2754_07915 [Actinobacteria bacterium]|nr:hypothetical protein [Actinomycetota bacterium]MSW90885.1 hypothetical protein [Actinomycetota bacterium]MSX87296.1 hypothetical protein [Actinomycetota bacterium]MSY73690.1 hypothetical protein [Actinomycetota bacterium]